MLCTLEHHDDSKMCAKLYLLLQNLEFEPVKVGEHFSPLSHGNLFGPGGFFPLGQYLSLFKTFPNLFLPCRVRDSDFEVSQP